MQSTSPEQTKQIAKDLAQNLKGGDIVLLHGDLGAGKTTFVKGLAEGLGVTDDITSPTFTLMNHYKINDQRSTIDELVHVDTYRLEEEQELVDIGIEDYLGEENTICVIEWPEKIEDLLVDKKTLNIKIEHDGKNERIIKIKRFKD